MYFTVGTWEKEKEEGGVPRPPCKMLQSMLDDWWILRMPRTAGRDDVLKKSSQAPMLLRTSYKRGLKNRDADRCSSNSLRK